MSLDMAWLCNEEVKYYDNLHHTNKKSMVLGDAVYQNIQVVSIYSAMEKMLAENLLHSLKATKSKARGGAWLLHHAPSPPSLMAHRSP